MKLNVKAEDKPVKTEVKAVEEKPKPPGEEKPRPDDVACEACEVCANRSQRRRLRCLGARLEVGVEEVQTTTPA